MLEPGIVMSGVNLFHYHRVQKGHTKYKCLSRNEKF